MAKLLDRDIALFETKPIYQSVFILAMPTIIGQLITIVYNLADTWFIAQTNDKTQVAAVTLVLPLYLILTVLSNLFGVGSGSLISRSLGQSKYEDVKKISSFSFWITIFVSILYSVINLIWRDDLLILMGAEEGSTLQFASDYVFWTIVIGGLPTVLNVVFAHLVRATGKSAHASIGMMIGALLNIILDPVFIFPWGLNLQSKGAAIATCISNAVATLYFLILLLSQRKKTVLSINPKYFTLKPQIAGKAVLIGLPNAVMTFCATLSNVVLNLLVSSYTTSAIAALGIVKKIDLVPAHIAQGFAQGILPLLSYNHSAKNHKRVSDTIRFSMIITVSFSLVFLIFYEIFSDKLMAFFIKDAETIAIGTNYIRLHCMAMPLLSLLHIYIAVFQAKDTSNRALILSLFRKGTLDIPLMILFDKIWAVYGIMLVQPILDFLCVVLAILFYYVFPYKGKRISRS